MPNNMKKRIQAQRILSLCSYFVCDGSACRESCCKGWQVLVDDRTRERYQKLKGAFGRQVRFFVRQTEPPVLRRIFGRCPFLDSDRLCSFQRQGKEELMPLICREYPKEIIGYGDFCEISISLSCPAAVRVFMDHLGRLSYEETEREYTPYWSVSNNDSIFLDFLQKEREALLDFFWQYELAEAWQGMYAHIRGQHEWVVRDRLEDARKVPLSMDKAQQGEYALFWQPRLSFFKIQMLDRCIIECIDHGYTRLREPKLYPLIRKYMEFFSKLEVEEADRFFDRQVRAICEENHTFDMKYRSYFSLNLQSLYLQAYSSYHILREFLFAVLYTELVMLFDVVEYLWKGALPDRARQEELIVVFERGVRHNPQLTESLLAVIREDFL